MGGLSAAVQGHETAGQKLRELTGTPGVEPAVSVNGISVYVEPKDLEVSSTVIDRQIGLDILGHRVTVEPGRIEVNGKRFAVEGPTNVTLRFGGGGDLVAGRLAAGGSCVPAPAVGGANYEYEAVAIHRRRTGRWDVGD